MVGGWRRNDERRPDGSSDEHLTRSAFVRAGVGTGLAFALGGGGYGLSRMFDVGGPLAEMTSRRSGATFASREAPTVHEFL